MPKAEAFGDVLGMDEARDRVRKYMNLQLYQPTGSELEIGGGGTRDTDDTRQKPGPPGCGAQSG
jgi:hypothetical protein